MPPRAYNGVIYVFGKGCIDTNLKSACELKQYANVYYAKAGNTYTVSYNNHPCGLSTTNKLECSSSVTPMTFPEDPTYAVKTTPQTQWHSQTVPVPNSESLKVYADHKTSNTITLY